MYKSIVFALLFFSFMFSEVYAQSLAKIKTIEGNVSVLRSNSEEWRKALPNMPLKIGDQLFSREESFVEVVFNSGAILRMDENTKIVLEESGEKKTRTANSIGNVWVNMQKLVSSGKEFELASPAAVAAIRGTVFNMSTSDDSSTDVSVYNGKVAVGPSDDLKKKIKQGKKVQMEEPTEVPGPEEVPGPYEVSLEQWQMIVAGQMISVRKDGKFMQQDFDVQEAQQEDFVKKNLELDRELEQKTKKKE